MSKELTDFVAEWRKLDGERIRHVILQTRNNRLSWSRGSRGGDFETLVADNTQFELPTGQPEMLSVELHRLDYPIQRVIEYGMYIQKAVDERLWVLVQDGKVKDFGKYMFGDDLEKY